MLQILLSIILIITVTCSAENELKIREKRMILSDKLRDQILAAHNYFRKLEGASDMKRVKWNDTLAQMAENWVKKCTFGHGQPSFPTSPFQATGQNIYAVMPGSDPSLVNVTRVVQSWYSEKKYYIYDAQFCTNECGHYTQVVWADTEFIGCAAAFCPVLYLTIYKKASLVVCNYGEAGNYIGQYPFKKGTPCDDCPNSCQGGLCD